MKIHLPQISLLVIFAALLIAYVTPLPIPRTSNGLKIWDGLFIHDKSFMWLLPPLAWHESVSTTGAEYALSSGKGVSLVLDTWDETRDDVNSMTGKFKANPSLLYDQGVKPRFPDSRFLGSTLTTLNSQPAIQSECEFVNSWESLKIRWFCRQVLTIYDNKAYNFILECPINEREFGSQRMKEALEQFVFLNGDYFIYKHPSGAKYEVKMSAGPQKEAFARTIQDVRDQVYSFDQHIIAAVINSFIQGMVLPLKEVPKEIGRFLDSPSRIWDWSDNQLIVGTGYNFPVSTGLQNDLIVRTARYVPGVSYVALIFVLIYRKRSVGKTLDMGKEQNGNG